VPRDYGFLAPGEAAAIMVGGDQVGFMGRIADHIQTRADLADRVTVVEMNIGGFEELARTARSFAPLPRFPAVDRDLAIVVAEKVRWVDVVACIEGAGADNLDSISFASLYRGAPVPEGSKSLAFHLVFRSPERTLTGREADEAQSIILAALAERLGASLR
jgi:phenylalanyl-tRNA synthetase beta chain